MTVDYERAGALRKELEAMGFGVILWCIDDFPGETDEERQENFDMYIEDVIDNGIERGNDTSSMLCGSSPNNDDEE